MANFVASLKNIIRSILKGDILARLGIDKYFIHIVYAFVLIVATVMISLKVETTLSKVEKNRKVLEELEIYHAERTGEMVKMGRLSTVEEHLKSLGSEVTVPTRPAVIIERR
jgi:hypothetical protein